jgi:hypothetical protein
MLNALGGQCWGPLLSISPLSTPWEVLNREADVLQKYEHAFRCELRSKADGGRVFSPRVADFRSRQRGNPVRFGDEPVAVIGDESREDHWP